ncbi:MAG: MarR family winged helix-turn-helix transcriptional regulator [Myxococcota bacterium]
MLVAHGALDESRRPCGAPLSTAHAWALLELREGGAITVSELAERLNIDRTNVSRLTMRMEANGEVTRAPHPADRRARSLTLTAKGARIAQSVNRSSTAHFRGIADHLDWETSEIIDALNSLTSAMSVASGTSASAGARA